MKIEHVLVPIDFSESSQQAITAAVELREKHPAQLTLLNVIEPMVPYTADIGIFPLNQEVEREEAVKKRLREVADAISPGIPVNIVCLHGKPWRVICDWAADNNADLIVIPTHGYSGLLHMWMGSVAERVVQKAPCPVLVVRAKS